METYACCLLSVDPCLSTLNALSCIVCEEDLCIYEEIIHSKCINGIVCICNNTLLKSKLDALSPDDTSLNESCRSLVLISGILSNVRLPSTYGNGSDNRIALRSYCSCTCDSDISDVIVLLNGPVSCEAGSCGKTLKCPVTCIVKVKDHFNLLNLFNFSCSNVHPVNGADEEAVCLGITGSNGHACVLNACLYVDLTGCPCAVACVISDLKLNGVNSVAEIKAIDGDLAVCISAGNFSSVNISLCCGSCDTCCVISNEVCNLDLECRIIEVDGLSVDLCVNGTDSIHYHGIGEYGILSVLNCSGIVNGNIIDIERILTVEVRSIYVIVIVVTVCVLSGSTLVNTDTDAMEAVSSRGSAELNVMPALAKLHCRAVCKELLTENGVDRQVRVSCIIGNVDPEAHRNCVCCIDLGESHVKRMEACLIDLSKVAFHCKCIATVLYLTCCRVNDADVTKLVLTVIPVVTVIVLNLTVRTVRTVLRIVCRDAPALKVLILEVVSDLCSLTERNICNDGELTDGCCESTGGCFGSLGSRAECEAVKGTENGV